MIVPGAAFGTLGSRLHGRVILPGDAGYADAAVAWERSARNRPDAVVAAAALDDIDATVSWAVAHRVPLAVQATGHGAVRDVADGILLDISALTAHRVDARRREATVHAGARWVDVIPSIADAGLSALWGSSSGVGATGYTLAGGMGPIDRTFGFAADRVAGLEVVVPEGGRLRVSAHEEPELFWGLRGGGGSLGVVRSVTFRLLDIDTVYGGGIYLPGDRAAEVLAAWLAWAAGNDERTSTSLGFLRLPASPTLPPQLSGRHVVHIRVAHVGADRARLRAEGDALVAPLRHLAPALLDTLGVLALRDSDRIHNDPVAPQSTTHRGMLVDALTPDAIAAVLDLVTAPEQSGLRMLELRQMGGALGRPAAVPNAVSGRSDGMHVYATAPLDPRTPGTAQSAIRGFEQRMAPLEAATAQLGFRGPLPDAAAVLACWDADTARRLLALKNAVDPGDILSGGQAIVDR